MKILFLDSATEACTVAVWVDGVILSAFELAPRGHAQLLLPMAEKLMAEAGVGYPQLDLVGFSQGPGSFTGVRIATACAQGIALGLDLPMVGISSLATLAQGQLSRADELPPGGLIHAAIDARMGEVYHGAFMPCAEGVVCPVGVERVLPPEALMQSSDWAGGLATGTGFGRYPELTQQGAWLSIAADALPHARDAIALASAAPRSAWLNPVDAAPVYLRDNVATPARQT